MDLMKRLKTGTKTKVITKLNNTAPTREYEMLFMIRENSAQRFMKLPPRFIQRCSSIAS
jgi:hypothetical protein